jgi:hypothetical protein
MNQTIEQARAEMVRRGARTEVADAWAERERSIIRKMGCPLNPAAAADECGKKERYAKSLIIKTTFANYSSDQLAAFIHSPEQQRREIIARAQRKLARMEIYGPLVDVNAALAKYKIERAQQQYRERVREARRYLANRQRDKIKATLARLNRGGLIFKTHQGASNFGSS